MVETSTAATHASLPRPCLSVVCVVQCAASQAASNPCKMCSDGVEGVDTGITP